MASKAIDPARVWAAIDAMAYAVDDAHVALFTPDMAKQIDDKQTLLTRMNEDAQKEVPELQSKLLGPVADRTQKIIKSYADEAGIAVVFDISSQNSAIIHSSDLADITTEVIRRIDADIAKSPAPAAKAPAPAAPAARPPAAAPAPATPAVPKK